jgi:hypothetical protein
MNSLQELCYAQIAATVETAPPLLQEIVMGETRERIKKNMKSEVKNEVLHEVKKRAQGEICKDLSSLVPDIMEDIIESMTQPGHMRRNYREELDHLPREVVECAIRIAEDSVSLLEDHYIRREFALIRQNNYMGFSWGRGNDF